MAPHILLADAPGPPQLETLTQALTQAGYLVGHASNPQQLVAAFDAAPADVVIFHLAAAGAEDACQALRSHALGATIPIAFVAEQGADIQSTNQALALGADALWRSPVDIAAALERIRSWVGPSQPALGLVPDSRTIIGPPPPAAAAHVPPLARLFGRAPPAAAQPVDVPPASAMAPPPAMRRSRPPAWPPRGMGGGAALAVAEPALCAPWSDPDAAAREHIRAACARMQVVDYFALIGLPPDAPYLVIDRALKAAKAQFLPAQFSASLRQEARLELQLIAQMLEEARFVLADAGRRRAYQAHMRPSEAHTRQRDGI